MRKMAHLLPLFLLSACSLHNNEKELCQSLQMNVSRSNDLIKGDLKEIYDDFEDKLKDISTRDMALKWQTNAKLISNYSDQLYWLIDTIKSDVSKKESKELIRKKFVHLYETMISYRSNILNAPFMLDKKSYWNDLKCLPDSITVNEAEYMNKYYSGSSDIRTMAMLSKIQNDIKFSELELVRFCHSMIGWLDGPGSYTRYSTLIGLSSICVAPGDSIELTAGMGEFTLVNKPEVFINGVKASFKDDVVVTEKIKAPLIAGKYAVNVKIRYVDEQGKSQEMNREMHYTVAKIR